MVLTVVASAQESVPWKDPAKHKVHFVTVDEGVQLEVLDWGGPGRSVVLLAGSGNTGHVYDDFAPKLSDCCHVYAITRRGFGNSSRPKSGYNDQRLADDVLQVLDALEIDKPVLVGHSMAGSEMTTLGAQHSNRLSGLVYLDAGDDPGDYSLKNPAYLALFDKLPALLHPPPPSEADKQSFQAYRDMQMRTMRFAFPESELRNIFISHTDGTVGLARSLFSGWVSKGIDEGSKKRDYSNIRVPLLAFFAVPPSSGDWSQYYRFRAENDEERAALKEIYSADRSYIDRYEKSIRDGVPDARIVELPGADHYVFFSNEADVLRQLRTFLSGLHSRGSQSPLPR